jgi:two-component system nitrate/nitrite response regulator NarL
MTRAVLLVDDQVEFLHLLRSRLGRSPGLAIVGEATSGEQALEVLAALDPTPHAALVDIEMPGMDGFVTAQRLRERAPTLRVVLISASNDRRYGALAAAVGAVFLPKRDLTTEAVLRLLDDGHQGQ